MSGSDWSLRPQTTGLFTFNAYDIFTNFLPGVVLLFGILFPLQTFFNNLSDFSLQQGILFSISAFVLGTIIQTIGSELSNYQILGWNPFSKRAHHFNKLMKVLSGELHRDAIRNKRPTDIDESFYVYCSEAFELNKFDDWNQLFKFLFSYLESTPWNRALRLQTLHLAMRGIYVTSLILALYYLTIFAYIYSGAGFFPFEFRTGFEGIAFIIFSFISFISFIISIHRTRDFEETTKTYLVSEVYLSLRSKEDFEMPISENRKRWHSNLQETARRNRRLCEENRHLHEHIHAIAKDHRHCEESQNDCGTDSDQS